jgi:dephospho-CoA kinase
VTKIVALTGSVASGKSTVAKLMVDKGATLIDADALVHELQAPGQAVFGEIVDHFGVDVISPAGTLDRAALRTIVLSNERARRELESIVHPAVKERRNELIEEAITRGDKLVLVDIPLLFEAGEASEFSTIIVVDAPPALRRTRLISLRHMDADEADLLMASQLPSLVKRFKAEIVIDNDGTIEQLTERTELAWELLNK